ncbi:MAG: Glycerol-3-phosphate cytidylyltransferase [candidate division WS2 bacterium ADurb.Bin280]|uniref:Glycerol-3-phosphate cytidylyltransferase n=1 Tax=candidate division WS2 bacterium ADurb.Bin280 TaxID=1852829 RepID=A0A1V5SC69_9BACT|nr:MAG: Glycerol-3-phosphate cytidylyltransferase [candidate division WS2 bacterium ADurb.Bin280]
MKKVIVFGSFDPLHKGHLNFFKQAKDLGNFLTVVVARDENIRNLKKHQPLFDEQNRLEKVKKQPIVDEAILGDKIGEYAVLNKIDPDIIAIGYDQKIPEGLKNQLKKYKIVTLKPYKSDIYKSSLLKE